MHQVFIQRRRLLDGKFGSAVEKQFNGRLDRNRSEGAAEASDSQRVFVDIVENKVVVVVHPSQRDDRIRGEARSTWYGSRRFVVTNLIESIADHDSRSKVE